MADWSISRFAQLLATRRVENGFVCRRLDQGFGLSNMPRSRKTWKTAMVSMHEASPNLRGMQGEKREMFLWQADFRRILQDD